MVVSVRFVGSFRSVSGKSKFSIKFEEAVSLREAIDKIVAELPKLKRALIDAELGDPRPNALILVNGKDVSVLKGLETMLRDGDEVVFVPVFHGG